MACRDSLEMLLRNLYSSQSLKINMRRITIVISLLLQQVYYNRYIIKCGWILVQPPPIISANISIVIS